MWSVLTFLCYSIIITISKILEFSECNEYAGSVYVESSISFLGNEKKESTCAAVVQPLIVNGKNTDPREYPHMVSSL